MLNRFKTRKAAVAVGAIVVLAAGTAAFAYWTNPGAGTGTAATGTTVAITVTQTSTPTGLYPAGPTSPLAGKFDNTNDSAVQVHEVDATIDDVTGANIDGTHPCTAADYQLNGFPVTVDSLVPSGTAQGAWTGASVQMLDTGVNQDGCKDAVVHLAYTSN